jgi:hypothetical protein
MWNGDRCSLCGATRRMPPEGKPPDPDDPDWVLDKSGKIVTRRSTEGLDLKDCI